MKPSPLISQQRDILATLFDRILDYLPLFFGGLLIFIIGLLIASLIKRILLTCFRFFRLSAFLARTRLMRKEEVVVWEEAVSEIVRWIIVLAFLVPTLETWGLQRATSVLNQFLVYTPNVIVALVIGFLGIITANLLSDLTTHAFDKKGAIFSKTIAEIVRSAIIFFTILVALNQLGVAQDLIRILFTGIVAAVALAVGLAFGLGGRESARDLIDEARRKLKETGADKNG